MFLYITLFEIFCQYVIFKNMLEILWWGVYLLIKEVKIMGKNFLDVIKSRRSVYGLSDKIDLKQQISEVIKESIVYAPSSFNSQSARIVVLFGEQHHKLWQITSDCLQKIVPTEKFASTKAKIQAFDAAYGTVLFFEDQSTVTELQNKFPLYKDNFPIWSEQANAMLQYCIWCALADIDVGANLQHYNPLIDENVRKTWNLPNSWKLIAQMPFGAISQPAGEKTSIPLDQKLKIFS